MRMPWSKLGNLQLDLLDAPTVPEAAPSPPAAPGAAARSASMVPTASLYEDANNPRTEIPGAELDELAEDIRQHGILQPIIVHRADRECRYRIHFGAKRWRAAQRVGLLEVPVVVRDGPTNPYAQVAENQKRHGLTPLDLARFIRGRIDAGDSNTTVAKTLGIDLTTVAHHVALLDLPPVVDAAMKAGRCFSPRTLYELGKLHAEQPERVAELVAGTEPTRRKGTTFDSTLAVAPGAASTLSGTVIADAMHLSRSKVWRAPFLSQPVRVSLPKEPAGRRLAAFARGAVFLTSCERKSGAV